MPTLNSLTDLGLDSTPQVTDPDIYEALLRIHSAIEILLTTNDVGDAIMSAYIAKQRSVIVKNADYIVTESDGTILVSASLAPVTITLPPAADVSGYRFNIKTVDGTFPVTLVGDGAELIDSHTGGIRISTLSSYTVISTDTGWAII